jgi:hypothetical protein
VRLESGGLYVLIGADALRAMGEGHLRGKLVIGV